MIRWRLVIHESLDCFSCVVVYIKCANNNCAPIVMDAFLESASEFGTPACIRSDHGGKINYDLWSHMLSTYNDPSCVLTRRSTHNEKGYGNMSPDVCIAPS